MDDDDEAELRNPFPSPPSHYTNYTSHNLKLLSLLQERLTAGDAIGKEEKVILEDQNDVPDWPLAQLQKPRVDWILEEGTYSVFGDTWSVKESIPSLGESGGQQLYPADPTIDRRPSLLSILRSLLATYSLLLKALLSPPPAPSSSDLPEWQTYIDWMNVMAQNIMSAANDLRPVQARYNLEAMMKRQLELRRQETTAIHLKCDDLQRKLAELKAITAQAHTPKDDSQSALTRQALSTSRNPTVGHSQSVDMQTVLQWAESA